MLSRVVPLISKVGGCRALSTLELSAAQKKVGDGTLSLDDRIRGRRLVVPRPKPLQKKESTSGSREAFVRSLDAALSADACGDEKVMAESMKALWKMAVDSNDRRLASSLLEATVSEPDPADLFRRIDPDHKLLSYCVVKLTGSGQFQLASRLIALLSTYDPFLFQTVLHGLLESADLVHTDKLLGLSLARRWPFSLDPQAKESLITDVLVPNTAFARIKEMFRTDVYSADCYTTVLLAIVNPDPTAPTEPQYRALCRFVGSIKKCEALAQALDHLFKIWTPPVNLLLKLDAMASASQTPGGPPLHPDPGA